MKKVIYSTTDKMYTPEDGYWYLSRHGVGPGTIPSGVRVLEVKDHPENRWKCYILLDRMLTTQELNEYDLKEEMPVGASSVKAATYRGAWDQEMAFFNREELNEFGQQVEDKLNEELGDDQLSFRVIGTWEEKDPDRIEVDVDAMINGQVDYSITCVANLDYRKIRTPRNIVKLLPAIVENAKQEFGTYLNEFSGGEGEVNLPELKYYRPVTDEEVDEMTGTSTAELGYPVEVMPGYNAKHLGWYVARPEYEEKLRNDGIDIVELVREGNDTYLGYAAGDRIYSIKEEDLRSAFE